MKADHTPLASALLACEIAQIGIDPASLETDSVLPQESFLLEVELAANLSLSIEFLEQPAVFVIRSDGMAEANHLIEAMRIALQLNHVMDETDRLSVNPVSSALVFVRRLSAPELELSELAFAIRVAAEVGLSLVHGRVPAVLLEGAGGAASEAVSTINALRV
jgi:hypothetical protein